ncbi:hypothetical protein JNB88_14410 [Rhizobium cauense]|uniref:hypothetical protein n=1 Tax=Rhizobium cauense TaxID=1166683 RepID=UPI001C6EEEC3|nr:hypothetical protein [Rhizobium cauense]
MGFAKITHDLTERMRAEEKRLQAAEGLRRSEEQFRNLVQGVEAVENRERFLTPSLLVPSKPT